MKNTPAALDSGSIFKKAKDQIDRSSAHRFTPIMTAAKRMKAALTAFTVLDEVRLIPKDK